MATASAPAPAARGSATNPWLVLVLVCLAQFMVVLDATIVNVALPAIDADLGFSEAGLQWVVNAYTLVFGGFLLLGGRAGDLFGRKRLFLIGLVVFTVASLLNGLATEAWQLIAFRALQGLGAALVSPAALSIVTSTFAEGKDRSRALAAWAAIAVGGAAVGLLLGGMLTEWLSWEWNFFINVPVGIVTFLLAMRYVPESKASEKLGFDLGGAVTVTAGLMLIVYGIVGTTEDGWLAPKTLGLLAAGVVLLAIFVAIELRVRYPLVRLGIFRSRAITGANLGMLVVAGGMFGVFFFASLYLQNILGFTPIQAGLAFLPLTAGIIIASGLAQQLVGRIDVRWVAIPGMLLAGVGLLLLTSISVDGTYLVNVLPGILVLSIGLGLTFVPMTLIATTGVQQDDAGLASGLFNSSQQIGGALGLAILATLSANATENALTDGGGAPTPADQAQAAVDGFQVAFATGAGLMILGAIVLFAVTRKRDVAMITGEETVVHGV